MNTMSVQNKQGNSKSVFNKDRLQTSYLALASLLIANSFPGFVAQAHAVTSFERLSSLLAATPEGGWVKASTNFYSDAWPTGADGVQLASVQFPGSIVRAWSSFAWDPADGKLMLWGGGHANYAGNEMYVWDGATGAWGRGSLPSKTDMDGMVIGGTAPQSAHTYDNNIYLPVNDMFLTFGGAAIRTGGNFQTMEDATIRRAGPYLWDPAKADPNKVGGSNDSGWNPDNAAQNGNMWIDRHDNWTGSEPSGYINSTTAYATENGQDVVYLTADRNSSGFPSLYRYTLGDVRNGGQDKWEQVGVTVNSVGSQSTGTIDTENNLYIKTALVTGSYTSDLTIWDLDKANAADPRSNPDIGINLVKEDGSDFVMTRAFGIDYDKANNQILLWDGKGDGGTVWSASVITDEAGNIGSNTTWTVIEHESSTLDHPHGNFATGVLGKWHYDESLGAFIALDELASAGGGAWDASIWLYKPTTVVPEPETYALMLAGLGLIGWVARRRSREDR
ncbi:PEP-CTERM protein-sorting domain-containing protein [Nitrosospira sp. Nl5]|uniref:PEP-CTERM sorting domain-containing protein n=1 Tax=Nitrosospira sp. Nl5 TaxID=200120 RepID=UPI00088C8670|nr:PEP-CTERM sorting domain-containing protein [Nitrosospira sp. Nl5]SCY15607.1 PEP-CTERM protein-sorting domain-containing protein [Nitrosospira sp. Nl5]